MRALSLLFISFFTIQIHAKTVVISDIDDTLKVTHVLSKLGSGSSFFDQYSHFSGMNTLFNSIQQNDQNVNFYYVSLAPQALMENVHLGFLRNLNFPLTKLYTNPGIKQDPNLKQIAIRQILNSQRPDQVLFFGDNGQFDTDVYEQMKNEYPKIHFITYIREAYSKKARFARSTYPTKPGQIGFVTSAEVALDLKQRGFLKQEQFIEVVQQTYFQMNQDDRQEHFGAMVFPWWMDCRDFSWRWSVPEQDSMLTRIYQKITQRCSVHPIQRAPPTELEVELGLESEISYDQVGELY